MKLVISICVVLVYFEKVVGSTMRKNSVEIHIKDGIHSPLIIHIRDKAQNLRTSTNKHHSDGRYDHDSEIKHRKVLLDKTYSIIHNIENTGKSIVNTANWKNDNSANKMNDTKSWSTSWSSNSKSNGGATDYSTGNGGQWSWSTSGENKGTSASNGGGNGGQWSWSTSGGNKGTSASNGGSNGGQWSWSTSGGNKGTSASNGGNNGGQWSWSTSGGQSSGENYGTSASNGGQWTWGGAVGGKLGGAVGGNLGGAVGGKMGGAVDGNVGGAVGGNLGGAVGGKLGGSVGGNVGGGVGGNLGGAVGGNLGGTVSENLGGAVGGNLGGAVGGNLGGSVSGNLGGAVGGNLGGSVSGNLGGAVSGNLGGSVGGNMGGAAGGKLGGAAGGNLGGSVSGNLGGAAGGNVGGSVGGNLGGAAGGNLGGSVGGKTAGGTGMNIGFGGTGQLGGGISLAGSLGGGMSVNLGRTGNGGYLSAKGKFVFSQTIKEYQQDVLQTHNKYRKIHNAKALRLDPKLSKAAMAYARTLAKKVKKIRHSGSFTNVKVGENLLMSAVPLTGATVVKTWYDQVYKYDFKQHKGKNGAAYSAFVQIVWRKTRRMGAGRAVGKVKGQMFVFYCARYQPTGYVGTKKNFRRNVRRGEFKGMVAGQNGITGGSLEAMEDLQSFISSALNTHNMLRSMHGVQPLILSPNLCRAALRKTTADEGGVVSSEAGVNVFDICQGTISGDAVTKEWYKNVCFYDFGQQDSPRQTKSEFRQVIWKDSKNFGISYKVYRKEKKTCVRIVALYTPAMEEANVNLHDQVKKGKFLGCQNGVFTYKGGITVSQCG